jgi:transcriptional regulator with GAF, ATPase, and Fis domain
MDRNLFFREATVRICGSLLVEEFLFQSFMYVREFIPADSVAITHYDRRQGQHWALARATIRGGELLNAVISIPNSMKQRFSEALQQPRLRVEFVSQAADMPGTEPWIKKGFIDAHDALLSMRLFTEDQVFGAIHFLCRQSGVYTPDHADLLSLLQEPYALALSNCLRFRQLQELKDRLVDDNRFLHRELTHVTGDIVVGADDGLADVVHAVRRVAGHDSPVLLLGETGVGKDVFANILHQSSPRSQGPFVKVNCGAIPPSLMDSELFGHEKGAFTGAQTLKRGRFERAHGGTVFLDEVGELSLEAQVRLLRVLQNHEIERVGGTRAINVDIRVVAATNRDLDEMVRSNDFRQDLFYRLNVFPIIIPPLRDRPQDIPALIEHFLFKKSKELKLHSPPRLSAHVLDHLINYDWPGNVRELENVVERALILNPKGPLTFNHLQSKHRPTRSRPAETDRDELLDLETLNKRHIEKILRYTQGKIHGPGGAAEILGINPSTLRHRIRKLGIR